MSRELQTCERAKKFVHTAGRMTDWSCFEEEGAEFRLFVDEQTTFDEAVAFCEAENATLARISNQEEFNFVLDLIRDVDFDNVFLGNHSFLLALENFRLMWHMFLRIKKRGHYYIRP